MSSDDTSATRRALLSAMGATALAGCSGALPSSGPATGDTDTASDDATTEDTSAADPTTDGSGGDSADWPQVGRDPGHAGYVPEFTADAEPDLAWSKTVDGSVTTPTVAGDTVYVTRGAPREDRPEAVLEAYALESGERRWNRSLDGRFTYNAPFSNHRPVVRGRRICVSTHEETVAVNAETGEIEWRVTTDPSFSTPPTVTSDGLYVAGRQEVVALDGGGNERWRTTIEERAGSQLVAAGDDAVYVALSEGLLALDSASGDVRWEYAPDDGLSLTTAVVSGDAVVHAGFDGIEAVSTGGEQRWLADGPEGDALRPAVGDGTAFTLSIEGTVAAYELSSGEQLWRTSVGDGEWTQETGPILLDGTLVAGQSDGSEVSVHGLDAASGDRRWSVSMSDGRIRGPVVASGRLVAATQDRHVNTRSDVESPPTGRIRVYDL